MNSLDLIDAIVELREQDALSLAQKLLDEGVEPGIILNNAREAMEKVGQKFEKNLYFLPELMMAGEIMKQVSKSAKPYFNG